MFNLYQNAITICEFQVLSDPDGDAAVLLERAVSLDDDACVRHCADSLRALGHRIFLEQPPAGQANVQGPLGNDTERRIMDLTDDSRSDKEPVCQLLLPS